MEPRNRRSFLKDLGLGTTAFSIAGEQEKSMPGRPTVGGEETAISSTLMTIAAHPGDAFFAMGAPVANQIHHGGHGVFVSLSLGEKGSATIPPGEYGALQREATVRAAQMLGAQAEFLAYPDGQIPINDEASLAVCDMIREYQPAIVVTHWRGSWHKDHRACYEIVDRAIFYASLPAFTRKQPAHRVKKLFFAENWEDAEDFRPDTYLDISAVFERWTEACAVFPMWRGENGFRYDDYYRSLARANGCIGNFEYAAALMSPAEQLMRRVPSL
jgi:LmbE family N-acetylglucosaminyl deacetylase